MSAAGRGGQAAIPPWSEGGQQDGGGASHWGSSSSRGACGQCEGPDGVTHPVMRPTRPPLLQRPGGDLVTGGLRCLFVDLFEYQARDLLAKHGVPVLPGGVAETPEEAEAIAGDRRARRRQGAGEGRRPRQGRRRQARRQPRGRQGARPGHPRLDIKGHITHKVMVAQASDIAEEYYFSYLLDRSNRTFLAMASVEGGMEIEELAVDQARGAGPHPDRRHARASTRPRPPRSSTRRTSRPRCATR